MEWFLYNSNQYLKQKFEKSNTTPIQPQEALIWYFHDEESS